MITVSVVKKFDRTNELAQRARRAVSEALGDAAQQAAVVARQLVPVDTGYLRSSIFSEQEGELKFNIGASADYAQYVEEGTIHQEPQPYLRPAVELTRRELERRLSQIELRIR